MKPNRSPSSVMNMGLITITAGSYSNVVRVLVPLVVTNEQMDEGLNVLESALQAVYEKKRRRRTAGLDCWWPGCVAAGDSPATRACRCENRYNIRETNL